MAGKRERRIKRSELGICPQPGHSIHFDGENTSINMMALYWEKIPRRAYMYDNDYLTLTGSHIRHTELCHYR